MIQKAINIMWFRTVVDVGFVAKEYFSPLPVPTIAFILTAIECCIDEWSDGSHRETSWEEEQYKTVYQLHLDSLNDFRQRGVGVFEHFRRRLCEEAFTQAGVPPADLGKFTSNDLDTAHQLCANVNRCSLLRCQNPVAGGISACFSGSYCSAHGDGNSQ
ncbi:hypothetical protein V8E53_013973 [Lactarius tabidus]